VAKGRVEMRRGREGGREGGEGKRGERKEERCLPKLNT
jgi:hypothetical protein